MNAITSRTASVLMLLGAIFTMGIGISPDDELTAPQVKNLLKDISQELKKAKDDHEWAAALYQLEDVRNVAVAEFVGARLLREKGIDRQLIAAELLTTYTKPKEVAAAAGAAMQQSLGRKKPDLDVLERCIEGLGVLKHEEAIEALGTVLDRYRRNPWLPLAVLDTYRKIGRRRALHFVHATWKKMEDAAKKAEQGSGGGGSGFGGGGGGGIGSGGFGGAAATSGGRQPPPPEALRESFLATAHLLTGDETIETVEDLAAWIKLYGLEEDEEE